MDKLRENQRWLLRRTTVQVHSTIFAVKARIKYYSCWWFPCQVALQYYFQLLFWADAELLPRKLDRETATSFHTVVITENEDLSLHLSANCSGQESDAVTHDQLQISIPKSPVRNFQEILESGRIYDNNITDDMIYLHEYYM